MMKMTMTIDEHMIKDMIDSSDGFIVYRTRLLIEKAILKDINEVFTKWHIQLKADEPNYSAIFTIVNSIVDSAIDEYIKVQLDQEDNKRRW